MIINCVSYAGECTRTDTWASRQYMCTSCLCSSNRIDSHSNHSWELHSASYVPIFVWINTPVWPFQSSHIQNAHSRTAHTHTPTQAPTSCYTHPVSRTLWPEAISAKLCWFALHTAVSLFIFSVVLIFSLIVRSMRFSLSVSEVEQKRGMKKQISRSHTNTTLPQRQRHTAKRI